MKLLQQLLPDNLSNVFLYGLILFANIDYVGILDYFIKALIGGGVWCAFKLLQDYYSPRIKFLGKEKAKESEKNEPEKS